MHPVGRRNVHERVRNPQWRAEVRAQGLRFRPEIGPAYIERCLLAALDYIEELERRSDTSKGDGPEADAPPALGNVAASVKPEGE